MPNVDRRARTTAAGVYDHGYVLAEERLRGDGPRRRLWRIRAGRIVAATGALERPLAFAGNDRARGDAGLGGARLSWRSGA